MPEAIRYIARRDAGLCVACGTGEPVPGGLKCEPCLEDGADREAERRREREEAGLCQICGAHPPAAGGRKSCDPCLLRAREIVAEAQAAHRVARGLRTPRSPAENLATARAKARKLGRCIVCRKRKARKDRVTCKPCGIAAIARGKRARAASL